MNTAPAEAAEAASPTRVQGSTETIALTYDVGEGCGERAAFVALLTNYSARIRVSEPNSGTRTFGIVVTRRGRNEFLGKLAIDSDGRVAAREVVGASCAEVLDALALATVLAIDPSLLEPTSAQADVAQQSIVDKQAVTTRPPSPARSQLRPPSSRPLPQEPRKLVGVGAGATALSNLVPQVLLGPELSGALDLRGLGTLMPELMLSGGYVVAAARVYETPIHYAALNLALNACWLRSGPAKLFDWGLCGGGLWGRLKVQLKARVAEPTSVRSWAALELGPVVRLSVAGGWSIRLSGAAGMHLITRELQLSLVENSLSTEEVTLHRIRGAMIRVSAGVFAAF